MRLLRNLAVLVTLSAACAYAEDLAFLANATNTAIGKDYKAYIDKSSIHAEGAYQSAKVISIYDAPVKASGYDGVKRMVNIFQVDCSRRVKRVTYIAFLNSDGEVIVDAKYPDAKDEGFGIGLVDMKILPYLCPDLPLPAK
jgi:hypothetical protein